MSAMAELDRALVRLQDAERELFDAQTEVGRAGVRARDEGATWGDIAALAQLTPDQARRRVLGWSS